MADLITRRPRVLLVELNEINFDVVRQYLYSTRGLNNFRKLFSDFKYLVTASEVNYRDLEPWIQWVTVHTGKPYEIHRVFRLGDIVNRPNLKQIYEDLEACGLKVGAISPMNAENRLTDPSFFIPDPWTNTKADISKFSQRVSSMLHQTVNDNATSKVSLRSLFTLLELLIRVVPKKKYFYLFSLSIKSIRKRWLRALFLDSVIHHLHLWYLKKRTTDFSSVFFNAGAHIQHHYFLNSPHTTNVSVNPSWYVLPEEDPIFDMLTFYDEVIGDYLSLSSKGVKVFFVTGLSQVPYDRVKYYYRLKNHEAFLRKIGFDFVCVEPRMTRDFKISFHSTDAAREATEILSKAYLIKDGHLLFTELELKGRSVFVTLGYSDQINPGDNAFVNNVVVRDFFSDVAFVAVKNGMHNSKGFAFVPHECFFNCENTATVSISSFYSEIRRTATSGQY
jgi:hypothetical protein